MKKKTIKEYQGAIILGAGHSLICGGIPEVPVVFDTPEELNQQRQSFGLYNIVSDDFTQHVAAPAANAVESDDRYIYPIFRGLSQVIVRKKYDPIDFTRPGVLESAIHLLVGQTVYTNHWSYVDNQVGVVVKAFWDKGYTVDGVKVPPGINIQLKIDAKNNPKLADSLTMDPPSIHSNSVTVSFNWVQSHPSMSYGDFRDKVGTFDEKGELIRRIVTKINTFSETSLVSHGADPFAKIVGPDGKIKNAHISHAMDSFSAGTPDKSSFFFMSYKTEESFSLDPTIPNETNDNNVKQLKMNKEHLLLLAQLSGFALAEGLSEMDQESFEANFDMESFNAHLAEKPIDVEALMNLQTENTRLSGEVTTLTNKVTELEAQIASQSSSNQLSIDEEEFSQVRDEIIANLTNDYSLVKGNAPDEATTKMWAKSNLASLRALSKTYRESLEEKFPLSCKSCGSSDVSRATSNPEPGNPAEPPKKESFLEKDTYGMVKHYRSIK